jgi:hypothetical protein
LSEGGTGEYFLLENRQQTGFDESLPASGLLLWHIDENRVNNSGEWYPGCTSCTSHYKVALVQADGLYHLEKKVNRGDGGDPFPGNTVNRAITLLSPLSATLYSGAPAGFGISAISDSTAVMTADFSLYDLLPPVTSLLSYPALHTWSGSGRFSFSANEAAQFECRLDGSDYAPCASPYTFSGLADGSHTFGVRATDTAGNVETVPPVYTWTIDSTPQTCTVKIGDACFGTIADAYESVQPGIRPSLKLPLGDLQTSIDLGRIVDVKLEGGYDAAFANRPGTTVITGGLTISAGSLVVDRVIIRCPDQ